MNELLTELQSAEAYVRDRYNPTTPGHLSQQLTRIKPAAAKAGLLIELLPRTQEGRRVCVWKKGQDLSDSDHVLQLSAWP